MVGVTMTYGFDVGVDGSGKRLVATVRALSTEADERAKSLSEGRLSGLALLGQGADLVSGHGMEAAALAARRVVREKGGGFGVSGFASAEVGRSRYETGSHVDVSGLAMVAGIAFGISLDCGFLTVAPFAEYSTGSYNSYNTFPFSAPVHGSGKASHAGGGIMVRMDFDGPGPGELYLEASGRAGRARTDYGSGDLRSLAGTAAAYELETGYYGVHAGIGYVWNVSDRASLDIYAKYVWTRQEGVSVTLSTGAPVMFDDAESSRVRGGWRLSYKVTDHADFHVGAAYEHEFDGEMSASVHGFPFQKPSFRGGTAIGELGVTVRPSDSIPLSFEIGARGYAGQHKGYSGSIMFNLTF
jgi:hypothetical protein